MEGYVPSCVHPNNEVVLYIIEKSSYLHQVDVVLCIVLMSLMNAEIASCFEGLCGLKATLLQKRLPCQTPQMPTLLSDCWVQFCTSHKALPLNNLFFFYTRESKPTPFAVLKTSSL